MHSMWAYSRRQGFTIVELLIVIVVIAVLAAITIVAFNGIQDRAKSSAAQSGASQSAKKVLSYAVENADQYPADLATVGVTNSGDTTYEYSVNNTARTFCITTTTDDVSFYTSNTQTTPVAGGCPGHAQNGVAAITNVVINPHAVGSGWNSQTPGGTISYPAATAQDGGSSFQLVTSSAGQIRINFNFTGTSVVPGDVLSFGADVYSPIATSFQFEISVASTFPKSASVPVAVGWNRVTGTITIPGGISGPVTLAQLLGSSSTPASAGQTWRATRAIMVKGSHDGAYYDGNSSNWAWTGATNLSSSFGPPL